MLRSRLINGTELQFLSEDLRYWNTFHQDPPSVMISAIRQIYEYAKTNNWKTIGSGTISWYDSTPEKEYVDMTDYYSHNPECVS